MVNKAAYEDFKQASPHTFRPYYSRSIQMPNNFDRSVGQLASNRASVAKFEDQRHGDENNLDDTFTREEKVLATSASQPVINSHSMPRYNYFDDDDDNYAENLKLMYPEPGLRETFVPGVHFAIHKPKYLSPEKAMENNPYYQLGSTYSHRKMGSVAMTRQSYDNATKYGNGVPPSYGRIIGLSRRLDQGVSQKLKHNDAFKDHQDAIKELVNQEKGNAGFYNMNTDYSKTTISPRQYTQFQKNALNVINR